jgi:SIR2-like protein
MALFIFGAGATRGCSFVDPAKDPCLPPLDADFFTHLQRVQNPKHQLLIENVVRDVVEVFGQNFEVTMETVFSTLEHTVRMLRTTGENRGFRRGDLARKRDRLKQAIAVVLEDSLTERGDSGASSRRPKRCKHHEVVVRKCIRRQDDIISFNYDCVLDYALKDYGSRKWNPRYGYGLGTRGSALKGYTAWQPKTPALSMQTVHFYKLHGSLHFNEVQRRVVHLKQRPYTRQAGDMQFTILPPESQKAYDKGIFSELWRAAGRAIHRAKHIVVVGYSLPPTDLHSTALLRTSVRNEGLRSLVIVNPDREARQRIRAVMQRGLSPETRVLSFDYLHEFIAVERRVWRV